MTVNQTHTTHSDNIDLVDALHELGELHTVCAFAATDAVDHHIQRDPDELADDLHQAETYLHHLDSIAAQFSELDGDEAKHVLTGIHAATRHRVALQIHHARHHSTPDAALSCNDPHCRNGEAA